MSNQSVRKKGSVLTILLLIIIVIAVRYDLKLLKTFGGGFKGITGTQKGIVIESIEPNLIGDSYKEDKEEGFEYYELEVVYRNIGEQSVSNFQLSFSDFKERSSNVYPMDEIYNYDEISRLQRVDRDSFLPAGGETKLKQVIRVRKNVKKLEIEYGESYGLKQELEVDL